MIRLAQISQLFKPDKCIPCKPSIENILNIEGLGQAEKCGSSLLKHLQGQGRMIREQLMENVKRRRRKPQKKKANRNLVKGSISLEARIQTGKS